jgi:hypothetical protein
LKATPSTSWHSVTEPPGTLATPIMFKSNLSSKDLT